MENLTLNLFEIEQSLLHKIILSLAVIVLVSTINTIIKFVMRKHISDLKARFNWTKTIYYINVIIGTLVIGKIWFAGFNSILTFLGLLSAGIAIALKDIMLNYAGWIYIVWKKPFHLGERIQVGDIKGDVVDIRSFQFILMEIGNWVHADQSTGRLIHIPNGQIFTTPIHNYEAGFTYIWSEILVNITFESNWEKAKNILLQILNEKAPNLSETFKNQLEEAAKEYLIYYNNYTPIVYTNITKQGIGFDLRYLVAPRERRAIDSIIMEEVLVTFSKEKDINFSYPTTRFLDYTTERKDAK